MCHPYSLHARSEAQRVPATQFLASTPSTEPDLGQYLCHDVKRRKDGGPSAESQRELGYEFFRTHHSSLLERFDSTGCKALIADPRLCCVRVCQSGKALSGPLAQLPVRSACA